MVNVWWKQSNPQSSARRACAQRLSGLLKEYGIPASGFAEVLRITPQCLCYWKRRGVPRLRVEQLARLLSVSEVWLATGEGERASGLYRQREQDQADGT